MYTPQTEPVRKLAPQESRLDYPFIRFCRSVLVFYERAIKFREPVLLHPERMIETWRQFQERKIRLVVGFRHPYGDDPQLMAYVIHHALPKAARKTGKTVHGITHVHFIYGVEVPLWSGKFVGWLLPKVGAVPVDHVHMDAKGMTRIRKIISDGAFPTALAPEGHVTYGSERIGELETGTARFCLWCVEDLARANRTEKTVFLPVSTFYRYGRGIERKLSRFVAAMETECGIAAKVAARAPSKAAPGPTATTETTAATAGVAGADGIASRLRAIGEAVLSHLESFYTEIGGKKTGGTQADILEAALEAAERIFAIPPAAGEKPMARLYRIRAAGWDRIFRGDLDGMTPLRREMAGRETGEAWYAMRHMETVELLTYVDLAGIPDGEPIERYVEIANNLYDIIGRIKGGTLRDRANAFDKYAVIVPGEPIVMNGYYDLWKADKKAALKKATDDMREEYQKSIKEYQNEYRKTLPADEGGIRHM